MWKEEGVLGDLEGGGVSVGGAAQDAAHFPVPGAFDHLGGRQLLPTFVGE